MKTVLGFIGSPRENGNSSLLALESLRGAQNQGAVTKTFYLNQIQFKGCQGCFYCKTHTACQIKDEMSPIIDEIIKADGIVIASPLYMWGVNGQTKLFLDRLLPLIGDHFKPKYSIKKTLMIYSQGNHNPVKFSYYFKEMKKLLKVVGFLVSDEIIAVKADKPGMVLNSQLMEQAYIKGKNLVLE